MTKPEHVIFSAESAWGTWVTPAKAHRVSSFKTSIGRARIQERYSGPTRALTQSIPGEKSPGGSFEMPLWQEGMGLFFKHLLGALNTTTPGGTLPRQHGIYPDEAMDAPGLSAQVQWTAALGINLLGITITKATISCKAKERAMVSFDYIARDEALIGGTWDYDGVTASPAIIATPTYVASLPFIFTGATLYQGGTPTWDNTKKLFTLATPTAKTNIESIELTIESSADARIALGAPTPANVTLQDRSVSGKFDYVPANIDANWYTEYRAGTQSLIQLKFLGANIETTYYRTMEITLPLIDFSNADWPEAGGSKDRRIRSAEFTAVETTIGLLTSEIAIMIQDTQTAY